MIIRPEHSACVARRASPEQRRASIRLAARLGTLVRWHRAGFRRYWRWQSLGGRPPIEAELRALIRQMSTENLLWGARRIHGELLKLGFEAAQYSGNPAFRRPSINSFAFEYPPRAISAEIVQSGSS